MSTDPKNLYLDLMKKVLTDYLRVGDDYANGMPSEYWWPKSALKNLRNRWLIRFLHRGHMLVLKHDRLTPAVRREQREKGLGWPFFADTMIGLRRLDNIQALCEIVIRDGVPGDFIETGVWKGGAAIFMRAVLKAHDVTERLVWACDSFEGLPPPEPDKYPADVNDPHHTYRFLAVSQEQVEKNFEKYSLLDDQVRFVKGFFEHTLEGVPAEKFALLRLDGDMYSSTIVALQALYPRLSPGGFIIIDDYHLGPCKQAVDDYRKEHGITEDVTWIDESGVFWRKAG